MRPTLQPRLQGSFKHGNHRRFHSMIMQVCEFDFLRHTALDHEAMLPFLLSGQIEISTDKRLQ